MRDTPPLVQERLRGHDQEREHREADAGPEFKYRIARDALTRSMRFEAVEDPFAAFVQTFLAEHPDASGNDVYKAAEGRDDRLHKSKVHALVKTFREGGSEDGNHPGTTPSDPPLQLVPDGGTTAAENGRPGIGDDGYQERLFTAFEAGLIVESEWHVADRAHRFVYAVERVR